MDKKIEKWTEIEHLPQWDEEFYHVYTAKKYGKWLMLKTLRPELVGDEKAEAMFEKEFDVRYNLAHPNIVMINDFEDVPGIGRCIITDDVYGDSMAKLIKEGKLTEAHLDKITHGLVDAFDYIQRNHLVHHQVRPETIIFTENIGNLKVIDVGFDQRQRLKPSETGEDIAQFGAVLKAALDALDSNDQHLRRIADRCLDPKRRYRDIHALKMAISGQSERRFYLLIIGFLAFMVVLLAWLNSSGKPHAVGEQTVEATK